ncbi:holo-ACP synthase [Oceaniserpentilla sp. 4NH20-0058]|uniref:holo-ACP synthase n=1 Tax=Oceaniserpentilla sp. 4NH20-0058 TaxID=3127660 RepID=UPI00310A770D
MTVAIGTDILEIERLESALSRLGEKFITRILTPAERLRFDAIVDDRSQLNFLAKRWCAKEAIAKALGTGIAKGVGWQQIEVLNQESGAPTVLLTGAALQTLNNLGASKALISLSDERHYCVAFCTLV